MTIPERRTRVAGAVRRWLFGHDLRPPRRARLAFFGFGLVSLAVAYVATDSEGIQLLVLFALTFGVYPALVRRVGVHDSYAEATRARGTPTRLIVLSFAFVLPWAALTLVLVADSLGPWFWWWLAFWPWLEVHLHLAKRSLERQGAQAVAATGQGERQVQRRRD